MFLQVGACSYSPTILCNKTGTVPGNTSKCTKVMGMIYTKWNFIHVSRMFMSYVFLLIVNPFRFSFIYLAHLHGLLTQKKKKKKYSNLENIILDITYVIEIIINSMNVNGYSANNF